MTLTDTVLPEGLVDAVRSARSVAVLTGAGISAESGISTFRDEDGLWAQFDPNEVATVAAFRRNPRMVWDFYAQRRAQIAACEPHAGHYALAELEQRVPEFDLVTQNIDEMHRRAGSRRVVELHGSIMRVKCLEENVVIEPDEADDGIPPRCPRCSAYLRPDVVWFGEALPMDALAAALRAVQSCDLCLSVGTSGLIEPAASLPFEALRRGATVVEINLEPTPLTPYAAYAVQARAGEVLPALVRAVFP